MTKKEARVKAKVLVVQLAVPGIALIGGVAVAVLGHAWWKWEELCGAILVLTAIVTFILGVMFFDEDTGIDRMLMALLTPEDKSEPKAGAWKE